MTPVLVVGVKKMRNVDLYSPGRVYSPMGGVDDAMLVMMGCVSGWCVDTTRCLLVVRIRRTV